MSDLIVMTFDDADEAAQVRESIRKGEHAGRMSLDDSAVVVKDEEGKVHVKNQMDRGVKIGAVGGGLLGLLLAGIFFPIGGIVLGVLGGGLIGASLDKGISKSFVKEVSDQLTPGTSALFIIVRDADPNYALGVLRNYEGHIYQTTLDQETEDQLRDTLEKPKD
ncbi:MAG: DUF1269 domain-containing protein [Chloroflexota bacterium]|nr:DUF1269 domain-containing protein [Chloroflexota bacterium]